MQQIPLSLLSDEISYEWLLPPSKVRRVVRYLQEADMLPTGTKSRRDRPPMATPQHAALLCLAVAGSIKSGRPAVCGPDVVADFAFLPCLRIDRVLIGEAQSSSRALDFSHEEDVAELEAVDPSADLLAVLTKQILVYTGGASSAVGVGANTNFVRLQKRDDWRGAFVDVGNVTKDARAVTTHIAIYANDDGQFRSYDLYGALPTAVTDSVEFGGGIFHFIANLFTNPKPARFSELLGVA